MKRLLTLIAFFATLQASAQQVNPVPDYVFANRMSAGRNTVTDTAAYFSIGPRYGATRGMMPPMVVDTASFSGNRRNGLLIFSVQKNKFLYWDSVGVKWAEMAGTGGTAISSGDTAAMLSPYVRHAGYGLSKSGQSFLVDTLNIATRAWRQKGIDSVAGLSRVGGSGTTSYVPKFTASSTIGNSQIFDNGTQVGIGTANPVQKFVVSNSGSEGFEFVPGASSNSNQLLSYNRATGAYANLVTRAAVYNIQIATTSAFYIDANLQLGIGATIPTGSKDKIINILGSNSSELHFTNSTSGTSATDGASISHTGVNLDIQNFENGYVAFWTLNTERGRINASGEWIIDASGTDAGDYKLQVVGNSLFNGNIRTAAPSGGTANDWRLGTVAIVSPTSPNRTIEVSIGGTIYYIHAKTTND